MAYGTRQDTQIHSVYFVLAPTAMSDARARQEIADRDARHVA